MIEDSIQAVVRKAEKAHSSGLHWHFHILAPTCCFNQRTNVYALVVEIPGNQESIIAYSATRPADEGKKLVTLLHGTKVLAGTGTSTTATQEVAGLILSRARELNSRNVAWHHHMLFPDCAFNPSPGKWTLLFEDPETNQRLSAVYDAEPLSDLKEVEALFYAQAK